MSRFTLPPILKQAQLKSLAFQCGISTSGTKSVLTARIHDELSSTRATLPSRSTDGSKKNGPIRLLSIDMGIRNLAYCMISMPKGLDEVDEKSDKPSLFAWHRTAVTMPTDHFSPSDAGVVSTDKARVEEDSLNKEGKEKECWAPSSLAAMTYHILKDKLLLQNPTHILIERQRFRSMGASSILEWTIRVNMFESMLYSSLHTLKAEGLWHGTVTPIAPGKVGPFWLREHPALKFQDSASIRSSLAAPSDESSQQYNHKGKVRSSSTAKLLNKGAKIDLVRSWLEADLSGGPCPIHLGSDQAVGTASQYLEKWNKPIGRPRKSKDEDGLLVSKARLLGEGPAKLDDLADCLLQGMAWFRWEENKRLVLKEGHTALDLTLEPASNRVE